MTSRDTLAGLVARDGAVRLDLDLLPLGDAVDLLRALIGAGRPPTPTAAAALADQCARLPLALRVAAELAADPPGYPARRPGRGTGRAAAPAGPAADRRGDRHRGPGGVLLVLPPPRPRAPRGPSGWPGCTPAPSSTASRSRPSPGRPDPRPGPGRAAARPAGPRPPGPAGRAGPLRHARPAARLRPRAGRPGPRARAPGRADPAVRRLPVHRGRRHGRPLSGRTPPSAAGGRARSPRCRR